MSFSIGQLSKQARVKVPTIRYYEKIGLLPEVSRNAGNQRQYGLAELERLKFIRHSRELGFEVDSIRELLRMSEHPQDSCHAADSIALSHLDAIRERIRQLTSLQQELERMVSECSRGKVCECRVIEVLANHEECVSDHGRMDAAPPSGGAVG